MWRCCRTVIEYYSVFVCFFRPGSESLPIFLIVCFNSRFKIQKALLISERNCLILISKADTLVLTDQTPVMLNPAQNKHRELFANADGPRSVCFPHSSFQRNFIPTSKSSFWFLISQRLCPGLGWKLVSNSSNLNCLCLSSLPLSFTLPSCPGRVRTRRQSSGSVGGANTSVVDSRGRSRAKVVSQSQRMYTHTPHVVSYGEMRLKFVTRYTFSITLFYNMYV